MNLLFGDNISSKKIYGLCWWYMFDRNIFPADFVVYVFPWKFVALSAWVQCFPEIWFCNICLGTVFFGEDSFALYARVRYFPENLFAVHVLVQCFFQKQKFCLYCSISLKLKKVAKTVRTFAIAAGETFLNCYPNLFIDNLWKDIYNSGIKYPVG